MEQIIEVPAMVNFHSHLREGDVMGPLIRLAMQGGIDTIGPQPNTKKELCTAENVRKYIELAKSLAPEDRVLNFLPHIMFTEKTEKSELYRCEAAGIRDTKIYPRDRTTKSENGVRYYNRILKKLKTAGRCGMRIHLHPEHPWLTIPNRDAEYLFLPIAEMLLHETEAQIFWEHGSDARCIPMWKEMAGTGRFFVALTAHHLATNEDAVYGDTGATCKPTIKTSRDREQLVQLVAEDNPWVMLGADDAPHDIKEKHKIGPCACGAYTAPFLLPLYAHALSPLLDTQRGKDVFVNFISRNARKVFGLPDASRTVKLVQKPFKVPNFYKAGSWTIEPFWASKTINWSIED